MSSTPPRPGPQRRKVRMLRAEAPPDDLLVVLRATPSDVDEAVTQAVKDAAGSALTYLVVIEGRAEILHGVSVFAHRDGVDARVVLHRFAFAPMYCAALVGVLRRAGFAVLPTGANVDHFDVQLVSGRSDEQGPVDQFTLASAAQLMIEAAGEFLPNPAYAYNEEEP